MELANIGEAYRILERRRSDPQRDRVRLSVLAEIGLLLNNDDDTHAILQRVCDVAVPSLGDRCAVYFNNRNSVVVKVADPAMQDFRSRLVVPLVIRKRVLGVLALARVEPTYDRDDLAFAGELARRVAMYLDHAMLLHDQRELIAALERTNRELDQFAYVASHDLRAPLRGISNLVGILEQDLGDQLDDRTSVTFDLLRNRAQRLEEMIEAVLRYSRAGRIVDTPNRVDLKTLVHEVVGLLDPPERARIEVDPHLPTLRTFRIPLEQVFLNLISNAIKHARRPDPRIEIGGKLVGDAWELFVRDDGPGIAPRHHDHVWKMFSTLQSRDVVEGAGMGLAIVRRIVESVGGRTWLDSDAGKGASFHFTWPLKIARWRPAQP